MPEIKEQIERMSHEELQVLLEMVQQKLEQHELPVAPEDQQELSLRLSRADANPLEGDDWPSVRERLVAEAALGHKVAA